MGSEDNGSGRRGPVVESVEIDGRPEEGLRVPVAVETDVACRVEVEVECDGERIRTQQSDGRGRRHELLVLGLHPDAEHRLRIRAASAVGAVTTEGRTVRTEPLPDDIPPLHVRTSHPEKTADGYRLLSLVRWERTDEATHRPDRDWGMALVVDSRGRVVWYHRAEHPVWGATRLPRGTVLYNAAPRAVVEIDMAGNVVNEWTAEALGRTTDADRFGLHHGVHPVGDGRFLTLSTEVRTVSGFADAGESAEVVGDVALEFDRSGEVVASWSMFDVLEEYRTRKRQGSTGGYWDRGYERRVNDWTHGNALLPGDSPGTLMASLRHQDWIVQWDRRSGELEWRLGPEGDFEFPEGSDGEWFYHQHAPLWLANGHLLVYDNGNTRPETRPGETPGTRVVEYRLDPADLDRSAGATGTVREVWSYEHPPSMYAPYVGDVDEHPDGNVLVSDGGLLKRPDACFDFDRHGNIHDRSDRAILRQDNQKWARLLELVRDPRPAIALEIFIEDRSPRNPRSYTVHGGEFVSL